MPFFDTMPSSNPPSDNIPGLSSGEIMALAFGLAISLMSFACMIYFGCGYSRRTTTRNPNLNIRNWAHNNFRRRDAPGIFRLTSVPTTSSSSTSNQPRTCNNIDLEAGVHPPPPPYLPDAGPSPPGYQCRRVSCSCGEH